MKIPFIKIPFLKSYTYDYGDIHIVNVFSLKQATKKLQKKTDPINIINPACFTLVTGISIFAGFCRLYRSSYKLKLFKFKYYRSYYSTNPDKRMIK